MNVLYPEDFDLTSIEKCLMDFDCNFIPYEDDKEINSRIGTNFIVLQETCFIAHVSNSPPNAGNKLFKCNYNCRNLVMKSLYSNQWEHFYDLFLETIDGVIHNTSPPYLLFTKEFIKSYSSDYNTIITNYTIVDIPKFVDIAKSKPCNDRFFVVYLGDYRYICCNMQTLETYEYPSVIKYRIIEILCVKSDDPFVQLKSEYEQLKIIKPLPTTFSDFQLKDIEGQPILENIDYRLEMYDTDEDVLDMYDSEIYATYYKNQVDAMVVQCSIIDGISYLVRKNRYLHIANGEDTMSFTNQIPAKHQRLQFLATEKNTFKTVQWNQFNYLTAFIATTNYTQLALQAGKGDHLELYLKRL
ncbi:hypothetical protein INT44_006271 [Umbelopsis vinacea]|uniref:Uncharacterized protein n=1 Tax=Umbelopsis vinacea TaxID=44442 RepID=A0A8H7PT67_9FUNG|nr:hypothetical protein INT44_006271 [Umbelopsis vinacea]